MEIQAKKNPAVAFVNYFREAKEELGKVTWPSRADTIRYAVLVIGASVIMAVVFAALDLGLSLGLEKLVTLKP
jgi:preprotein translocase subunit SecE